MFATERGGPFTSAAVNRLIKRIGVRAKLPSRSTPICSGTRAATRCRTPATTPGRCRIGWSPQHHTYGALHRAVADALQGFLPGLTTPPASLDLSVASEGTRLLCGTG